MESHLNSYLHAIHTIVKGHNVVMTCSSIDEALKYNKTYTLRIKGDTLRISLPMMIGAEPELLGDHHNIKDVIGYFIVNGVERVFTFREELVRGIVYVRTKPKLSATFHTDDRYVVITKKKNTITVLENNKKKNFF